MKKLLQILAVAVITMTTFATSSNAFATGTCAIGYTGPDSKNLCTSVTTYTCTVNNSNNIAVVNDGTQVSISGNANNTGNTGTGSASSGSATNNNGTTFNVSVTNSTEATPGTCTVVATVPATVTPTTTPVAATVTPVVAAPAGMGAASSLPNTSGDQTIAYAAGLAGILGIVAVISRLAISAYGRLKQ